MTDNFAKTLCWQITNKCNRSCDFCISKSNPSFKIKDIKSQFRIIERLKEIGVKKISISGGEPFLVKNLSEIVSYILYMDMKCQITTNSDVFIAKGIPDWIYKFEVPIILSLYGDSEEHNLTMKNNHFQKVLEISGKIKREQLSLNVIETPNSVDFIIKNLNFIYDSFCRLLLIKKVVFDEPQVITNDGFQKINDLIQFKNDKKYFHFYYHNYSVNDFFPVINDEGDILFTSNEGIVNIGSIFNKSVCSQHKPIPIGEYFDDLWVKQYNNAQMLVSSYEQYN